ncbi:MAG: hypothetical protein HRU40_16040, partial [Saprospiraceae bacterium]|nr:hypothetical protein [Saprospiraceae bacterium]
DEIYIRGNSQLSDEDIMGRAEIQPGDIVPVDDFKKIVEKLYGTNLFDIVKTSITKENGANVLYIDCKEKLTRTLSTALTYDSYTNAGFLFNANLRNVLLDSDRLMITAHITGQYRARFNYLKYLNRERTLMGEIDWQLHKDRLPILEGGVERQTYRFLSSQFSISLKRRFGQNGMFGLAMVNENYDFEPTQGRDLLFDGEIKISLFGFFGNVEFNSLNANVFPSRGTHITASVGVNTYNRIEILVENPIPPLQDSTSQFNNSLRVNFDMNSYFPVSDNGSIRVSPFLHAILNLKDNFSEYLMVGGPEKVSRYSVPFYGFDAHEIAVTAAAGGRLDYQQFLGDNLLLSAGLSGGLFGVPNSLFPTQDVRDYTFLGGMQMSVGYNTIVGPIRFYAMAPLETNDVTSSGWRTYLTFGYRF